MMSNGMTLYDLYRIILELNDTTGNEAESFVKFVQESNIESGFIGC